MVKSREKSDNISLLVKHTPTMVRKALSFYRANNEPTTIYSFLYQGAEGSVDMLVGGVEVVSRIVVEDHEVLQERFREYAKEFKDGLVLAVGINYDTGDDWCFVHMSLDRLLKYETTLGGLNDLTVSIQEHGPVITPEKTKVLEDLVDEHFTLLMAGAKKYFDVQCSLGKPPDLICGILPVPEVQGVLVGGREMFDRAPESISKSVQEFLDEAKEGMVILAFKQDAYSLSHIKPEALMESFKLCSTLSGNKEVLQ
jgi:hypothetical protein